MESIATHKLAALITRMPVDVFYACNLGEEYTVNLRLVKADAAAAFRAMDGRTHIDCELTLTGLYIYG